MTAQRPKILLSEGSSLSSREAITVAAYSLTPQAIHRLRAWHHAA
jgi:hypothetical protein